MDFLYHATAGLIIANATTGHYLPEAAVYAVLPDVLGCMGFAVGIFTKSMKSKHVWKTFVKESQKTTFYNSFDQNLYRTTHSIVAFCLFAILTSMIIPTQWILFSLCYLSHILMDIPTHSGDFSLRLFFPFSDWHREGQFWAKDKKTFLSFWLVLLLVGLIQFLLF